MGEEFTPEFLGVAPPSYKGLPLDKSEYKGRPANRPYQFSLVVLVWSVWRDATRKPSYSLPIKVSCKQKTLPQ